MSAQNSFGMLDCLGSNVIIHVPHSNTKIPDNIVYTKDIQSDIDIHTDSGVMDIFLCEDHNMIIYPYSRYFCDVERLYGDPMESKGMGIYYTHNLNGDEIRDTSYMDIVMESYIDHHKKLSALCQDNIDVYGSAIIIDAHSFSDDIVHNPNNIEICLGFNENINTKLKNYTTQFFNNKGFKCGVNDPYGGAIIPFGFEHNNRVNSIMIEINKQSYDRLPELRNLIQTYINNVNMFKL